MAIDLKQMTDEQIEKEVKQLIALKAWGVRLEQLKQEQSIRYGREMTNWVGSPAADCYYDRPKS